MTLTRQALLNRMTGQYTRDIVVDAAKCTACMECVEACKGAIAHEHAPPSTLHPPPSTLHPPPSTSEPVARITIKRSAGADGIYLPLLCRNCAEAPCVVACMTACRIRDESGWVTTDYSRCVGCWMCVMTCPFGAIEAVYEESLARKCDGCITHEIPPCVAVCEPGALRVEGYGNFGQERRQSFAARARAAALPGW